MVPTRSDPLKPKPSHPAVNQGVTEMNNTQPFLTKRAQEAALELLKTNALDPRNADQDEHPTWIVGTKELAELFAALHLPERHTLWNEA
jgi:hypothetical protein